MPRLSDEQSSIMDHLMMTTKRIEQLIEYPEYLESQLHEVSDILIGLIAGTVALDRGGFRISAKRFERFVQHTLVKLPTGSSISEYVASIKHFCQGQYATILLQNLKGEVSPAQIRESVGKLVCLCQKLYGSAVLSVDQFEERINEELKMLALRKRLRFKLDTGLEAFEILSEQIPDRDRLFRGSAKIAI